jgi:hypothetical protein
MSVVSKIDPGGRRGPLDRVHIARIFLRLKLKVSN